VSAAWLVLAVGADRVRAPVGYDDEPSSHYAWDSTVPNHASLAAGDVIALWDKKTLLGVSVIEKIVVGEAEKDVYTCPSCNHADFKARKHLSPMYRCFECKAEFDEPLAHHKTVTTYRSEHATAWVDLAGTVDGTTLRSLCDKPGSQLSLRPMQWEKLRSVLENAGQAAMNTFVTNTREVIAGGHKHAVVRVRVGQGAFRHRLLAEQGAVCAFSGPAPADVLEAAHLYSYASVGEHRDEGGLLLRRDLHRLFDLGRIAVNPADLHLDVHEGIRSYAPYGGLHGAPVIAHLTKGHRRWLVEHWSMHRQP
jgi:ribosomal protein L37AE/L43A